jgi:hypothetical protein
VSSTQPASLNAAITVEPLPPRYTRHVYHARAGSTASSVPNVAPAALTARRAATIRELAASAAAVSGSRSHDPDDAIIGAILEVLRRSGHAAFVTIPAAAFREWRPAMACIQRHPLRRGRINVRVNEASGILSIGYRLPPIRPARVSSL